MRRRSVRRCLRKDRRPTPAKSFVRSNSVGCSSITAAGPPDASQTIVLEHHFGPRFPLGRLLALRRRDFNRPPLCQSTPFTRPRRLKVRPTLSAFFTHRANRNWPKHSAGSTANRLGPMPGLHRKAKGAAKEIGTDARVSHFWHTIYYLQWKKAAAPLQSRFSGSKVG